MEKKPFEIKFKNETEKQTIKFSGNLIINHIEEILQTVRKKIDISKNIHINISNPNNIDLTFIQIILSLQKTYLNNNLNFSVSAKIKDDLKLILTNAGFNLFF